MAMADRERGVKKGKLGAVAGVFIPVSLSIFSILLFLRFGLVLGHVGLLGMLALLLIAYSVDLLTTLSLSAIASNGIVKGGGAYYLISRSLGPEFGGSIGILFYVAQVLSTALNVVGLVDCLKLNLGSVMPTAFWWGYLIETAVLIVCTGLCLAGSSIFSKASNALLVVLSVAILSIPVSALFRDSYIDPDKGIEFTGASLETLKENLLPHTSGPEFDGFATFREYFGIIFPATSGIFAGASMSGDLRAPSKSIPVGTLWAMLSTFVTYLLVIISLAASTRHATLVENPNVIQEINLAPPLVFAGELATTFFSSLMGVIGSAKLFQALAKDKLLPGLTTFGKGSRKADEPIYAIFLTYIATQFAMLLNLNQIASMISMGYQMTFFVMNLACFLLKIGSAPNFRPGFKFFNWQTALAGSVLSVGAMFFIDETYASAAVCMLVFLFLLIHYLSPPKHWGDVSQNLIYHQVRKYLLRLKPEHIKFWRPQIILLINNPRRQTKLIQFCNSLKKGALYILGHAIVTDDFAAGVAEAKLQQAAWTKYIAEYSRIKAFVQLTMSPTITWGIRNLVLSAGLGGMRPNIAVIGSYNMDELRNSDPKMKVPERPPSHNKPEPNDPEAESNPRKRRRRDISSRLLEGYLPTDAIRNEGMMSVTDYLTILEDMALRYRLNVAIAKGFDSLEAPQKGGGNSRKHIDLWPIQMSAEISAQGRSVLTTNFDTYTLILQLGFILHTVPAWKKAYDLRVLVFVEYESEVEEERGRVEALLESLRIGAEVSVFTLASGNLSTYEAIIHGKTEDPDAEKLVDESLKDQEWWKELKEIRGAQPTGSPEKSKSIARVLESAMGADEQFLPRVEPPPDSPSDRRQSLSNLDELPKKPTVSRLSRLGANMGLHTQNLPVQVLPSSDSEAESSSSSESDSEDMTHGDFNDTGSVAGAEDGDTVEPSKVPLLATLGRRKNYSDLVSKVKSLWKNESSGKESSGKDSASSSSRQSYGTVTQSEQPGPSRKESESRTGSPEPSRNAQPTSRPGKAALSRQSSTMKFSSALVPETMITLEGEAGPKIMFADNKKRSSDDSRKSPRNRSSERADHAGEESRPKASSKVSFANSEAGSAARSRRDSPSRGSDSGDMPVNIPEVLASYESRGRGQDGNDEAGSSYSTQALSLSFNDLPSRAQHLILNELMRHNSSDTVVLFTTLPMPKECTCQSEEASLAYLSNIEILCNQLPPALLVMSNNMTVTVSL